MNRPNTSNGENSQARWMVINSKSGGSRHHGNNGSKLGPKHSLDLTTLIFWGFPGKSRERPPSSMSHRGSLPPSFFSAVY